ELGDASQALLQAERIRGAAADVEGVSGGGIDALHGGEHGVDEVGDVKQIADLSAVAEQDDRLIPHSLHEEVGDPAPVFRAALMRAIDATRAEDDVLKMGAAGVVEDVLVGGPLGASV